MSTPPPNPVLGNWTPADLGLIALISGLGIGTVLWAGAALAALGSGHPAPGFAPLSALLALGSPADPGSVWPEPDRMPGPVPVLGGHPDHPRLRPPHSWWWVCGCGAPAPGVTSCGGCAGSRAWPAPTR